MEQIITVKNISKNYTITHNRGSYIALRDILTNVFKNPFAYLKAKTKEEFWALTDLNFTINTGEVVGVVGRNGAGKSTLLKILSQITPPTTGEIRINGTVGSLLEVGTGFHPELTGRENIFLNGAILGMDKKEIIRKFDTIVEFAGIGKFLDTPVKHYSSGMYVRLAFSVAAHMETDILIIDEVLAVGDAEFQKKCLGKMEDITKNEGRTILFVSHNLETIRELCGKTILLEEGKIKAMGDTDKVLALYSTQNDEMVSTNSPIEFSKAHKNNELIFRKIWITKDDGIISNSVAHTENFTVNIECEVEKEIGPIEITITLKNSRGVNITSTSLSDSLERKPYAFKKGNYVMKTKFNHDFLVPDIYTIRIAAHERGLRDVDVREDAIRLKIVDAGSIMKDYGEALLHWNCVFSNADWQIHEK